MTPPHWIHVYGRPLIENSAFIKRYRAYGYRHKISSVGNYDTMSCQLDVSRSEADSFFERLGSRIVVFVDNPRQPVWDGYLNRVTLTIGNQTVTSSLDEMANRATVVYSAPDVAAAPQVTTTDNVLASQAIYGVKEGFLDGYLIRGSALGKMDALRSTIMNTRAYPCKSYTYNSAGGGGDSLLTIECLGLYHTMQWEKYYDSATVATSNADVIMTAVLPTMQSLYFNTANTAFIAANGAFTQDRRSQTGQTFWEFFQSLQEAGDGSNKWVMGVSGFNEPPFIVRSFYYFQANTDIEYFIRSTDPKVRNVYGQYVDNWRVRPDRGVRVADILTGWNGIGDDPATFYIDSVEYDAESQSVVFGSTDNISLEGVMNLNNYFSRYGKRFGVTRRQTWS